MSQTGALYALYDDTINKREDADKAEKIVSQRPDDTSTRAQLVHYYYNLEMRSQQKGVSQGRLNHIAWFIKNQPDLEFCGTAPFYLSASDTHFHELRNLWQAAIDCSPEEMRRVNACMYMAKADRSVALELLNSLFPADSNNLWVLAMRDLLCDSGNCFLPAIEIERHRPSTLDDDCKSRLLLELKQNQHWDSAALLSSSANTVSDLASLTLSDFGSTMSLSTVAKIAGCSVFRFESNSILRFNPEAMALRFSLACWIIRYLPFSKLANSPIFMGPFERPESYCVFEGTYPAQFPSSLDCLFEYLAEHWTNQLNAIPEDKAVARNAASFAVESKRYFPEAAQMLVSALSKTVIGRAALKKRAELR